jgi:serine/threonine-protein kinase
MKRSIYLAFFFSLLIVTILSGCGGGSKSPGTSNPPGTKIVVTIIAGTPPNGAPVGEDGTGTDATFWGPKGITVDKQTGILYVTDGNTIRRLIPGANGYVVKTIAGELKNSPGMANGEGVVARFNCPNGITVGTEGWIYVADTSNHIIRRLKCTDITNDIYTVEPVAGISGTPGWADREDPLSGSAIFDEPTGIIYDPNSSPGALFVTDWGNNAIRKIVPFTQTFVYTIAGKSGQIPSSTDGKGGTARFDHPHGITIDKDGVLYVTDAGSDTIRKLTSTDTPNEYQVNTIFTLEGSFQPQGITVNSSGLYISECKSGRVRKMTNNDMGYTISTIAEKLSNPDGIASDEQGNLYVADFFHCTILKISFQ